MFHTSRHPASTLASIAVALMMCLPLTAATPTATPTAAAPCATATPTAAAPCATAIPTATVLTAAAPEVVPPGGGDTEDPPLPTGPTTSTNPSAKPTVADVATLATAILSGSTDTTLDRNGDHRLSIVDIVRLIDRLNHPTTPGSGGGETIIGGGNEEAD